MMGRQKTAIWIAAAAGVGILGTSHRAEAADGGGSCGGKLVERVYVKAGSTTIGQTRLYYDSAKRTACAITLHGGPTAKKRADTGVLLARSAPPSGDYQQAAYQRGNYVTQAGPIRADVTGRCYYSGGGITYGGKHYTVYTGVHC